MDWKATKLWQELLRREGASDARRTLENALPSIEVVLRAGGTANLDFTLHDAAHSFRVAERSAELLGATTLVTLRPVELSLLLLACYLHDIGMTPSRPLAEGHWRYLFTGIPSELSEAQRAELQRWLDSNMGGITAPIDKGNPTISGISLIEEIYTYYIRHKHNDWSALWIRENLSSVLPTLYSGWLFDLITLCRSHHEGLSELRQPRFDARVVGNHDEILNLRYLAAILRLADVLEFDPERTPAIILNHRAIKPRSRIYWHKDHYISLHLDSTNSTVILTARTPNAVVHKAVLETAQAVNAELATCSALQQENAYRKGVIPNEARANYEWSWPASLTMDVREQENSFVFIDGAFRPAPEKIIRLLSGTALYGNPMAAVRELLQNSFDAVREQMAYERLTRDDAATPEAETAVSATHKVRLSLERESDRHWLSCSDDGTGMTRDIIETALLVSGSDVRGEVLALERGARNRGFTVGRTGQFGIGVLSYFMIADKLEIITRRSQEALDTDNTGWKFVTEGLGSFGELSRASRIAKGTDVRLRLKPNLVTDVPAENWFVSLEEYVRRVIRFTPCVLDVRDDSHATSVSLPRGWTAAAEQWSRQVLSGFGDREFSEGLLTTAQARSRQERDDQWAEAASQAHAALRWFGPQEMELAHGLGVARAHLAYFVDQEESCVAFTHMVDGSVESLPGNRDVVVCAGDLVSSWRGFRLEFPDDAPWSSRRSEPRVPGLIVEVDFREGSEITVDRSTLVGGFLRAQRGPGTCATPRGRHSCRASRRLRWARPDRGGGDPHPLGAGRRVASP